MKSDLNFLLDTDKPLSLDRHKRTLVDELS